MTRQADWFTDPSFTAAERESTWKVVNLFHFGGHISQALAKLHTGEVAALADRMIVMKYASCFDSSLEMVQLKTVAPNLARALKLGQAIKDPLGDVREPVSLTTGRPCPDRAPARCR